MRSRHMLAVSFSIGLVVVLLMVIGAMRFSAAQPTKPNIIFILTDDLDADLIEFMPYLKSLVVEQGVTFANFFVNVSLCCPSRVNILRGQYAHNTQILTNLLPTGGFQKFYALGYEHSTVATWLQGAGYRTCYLGKYLNGYPAGVSPTHVPSGWSEWYSPVAGNPYSNFNYVMNENGKLVRYGNRAQDYLTDVVARKSLDCIKRTTSDGKPFFLHIALYVPHAPATPAPRHARLFSDAQLPRPPSFNEADVSDKPSFIRNRPLLTDRQIAQMQDFYRKRLQSLQAVDEMLASLIETLRAVGQLEKTYIFFTSDNGFHMGEHRLNSGKQTAYEEDIRVMLVVRGPGVPAGRVLGHLTGNIDLAPTFAELADAPIPDFVDGRSLVPVLGSNPPTPDTWRQGFLIEHWHQQRREALHAEGVWEPPDPMELEQTQQLAVPEFGALRTTEYLYVEYVTGERELYDLKADPYQLESLHGTAAPALIESLSEQLAKLKTCAGASCGER
ncbi:MAG: sulfatase-like hydrolase/transferase [Candidatus Bipolaricaulota bacterium]|nr:sulfatase-like hydrolase/transferase [Candidatus Bipolaricaulota bacterium]